MKAVNSTTWCEPENEAGKYLADTLTKICDEKLVQKVSVYFHRYRQRVKSLTVLDKQSRSFYLGLLLEKTREDVQQNFHHELVKTLVLNIINAIHKTEIHKIEDDRSWQQIIKEIRND